MKLRTLAKMSPTDGANALAEIVEASRAPRNGQMAWADERIAAFEKRYGMSTSEMKARFKAGTIEDTADVAQWLIIAPK